MGSTMKMENISAACFEKLNEASTCTMLREPDTANTNYALDGSKICGKYAKADLQKMTNSETICPKGTWRTRPYPGDIRLNSPTQKEIFKCPAIEGVLQDWP